MEVGEEASGRQTEELVPGQVEFSEDWEDQDKVSEVVVAQVQHLHTNWTDECVRDGEDTEDGTAETCRPAGRQGLMDGILVLDMLR